MQEMLVFAVSRMNYFIYIILMLLGLYGIFMKSNYMKKIIGLNILQTAIILFFISTGAKTNATLPILVHGETVRAADYMNPLPHVLMLTAIVVAVATLGVALAMAIKIYQEFHTIEENQVLDQLEKEAEREKGL